MTRPALLAVRLGAMGDIIHALPAVASLKRSFPDHRLYWAVAPKWMPLLEGNPFIDEVVAVERATIHQVRVSWKRLRSLRPLIAVDFQGLVQSALVARAARPEKLFGFDSSTVREAPAAWFYSRRVHCPASHVVDKNLELAQAAGASTMNTEAWIPAGRDEGQLPDSPFVLCNPFAGWNSKQWPIENYEALAQTLEREGLRLVVNVPASRSGELAGLKNVSVHSSSLAGLISATRRAAAVVGLDSGPLHLAAALHKPGVALFGPTDPARNGPYGGTIQVLRAAGAATTYKRGQSIHPSMASITVDEVTGALMRCLSGKKAPL